MKVLEAISDTNIGGAGNLLLTRLRNSDRERITSAVVLPFGSRLGERFEGLGVRCYYITGGADKSFDIKAIKQICEVINDFSPDVINTHAFMSARIAAALCKVPVRIYTRHCAFGVPLYMRSFPLKQAMGAIGSILSTGVIAVADAAADDLISLGMRKNKIRVIINGVDRLRKYTPNQRAKERELLCLDGKFAVGICARLEKCKDHATFLRAARVLCQKSDRYRFLIIGDGKERQALEELCEALGICDKVRFLGFCDDVERYYNCLDLNVNCSVGTETSSLALSEGMSIGLPAVASSFGGNPNMVRDGVNGYIYKAGDFMALAERIEKIASDRALYERLSEGALSLYEAEFNSDKMTKETESFYAELYEKNIKSLIEAGDSELG